MRGALLPVEEIATPANADACHGATTPLHTAKPPFAAYYTSGRAYRWWTYIDDAFGAMNVTCSKVRLVQLFTIDVTRLHCTCKDLSLLMKRVLMLFCTCHTLSYMNRHAIRPAHTVHALLERPKEMKNCASPALSHQLHESNGLLQSLPIRKTMIQYVSNARVPEITVSKCHLRSSPSNMVTCVCHARAHLTPVVRTCARASYAHGPFS